MKTTSILAVMLIVGLISAAPAFGQDVPRLINYQGNLMQEGQPVEGPVDITFSLYDVAEGGTALWSEAQNVTVMGGYYSVLLGSVTALPGDLFTAAERYLGITIGTEAEMVPRIRIASVAYSLNADQLDGQEASDYQNASNINAGTLSESRLPQNAIDGTEIQDGSLTAADLADEPGIARNTGGSTISTSGVTNITSRSITVPAAGNIVARGYAWVIISGTSIGNILMGIETSSTASPSSDNWGVFGSSDESLGASETRWGTLTLERTFTVTSSGTYTYYLNASRGWSGGSASAYACKLLLTYYATEYGTVSLNLSEKNEKAVADALGPAVSTDQ